MNAATRFATVEMRRIDNIVDTVRQWLRRSDARYELVNQRRLRDLGLERDIDYYNLNDIGLAMRLHERSPMSGLKGTER